jgi:hypothetical protein
MSAPTPKIVLTMIVKNEAPVIERCIRSIRPLIDAWCIVDTGSTDGTQEIIRKALADLPGELVEIPWQDFAFNRTKSLELARPFGDFSIMIDADVECVFEPGFNVRTFKDELDADVYRIMFHDAIEYQRPLISSTDYPFSYRGVLHEFLVVPDGALEGGIVKGLHYKSHTDGARWGNPTKYADDALLLMNALASGDDPELDDRHTFYLAQSLRDSGDRVSAAMVYKSRAQMGGWDQERYMAWLWHARLLHETGGPLAEVLDALMKAQEVVPSRAEAYCQAARYAREADRMQTAFMFATRAAAIRPPEEALFMERDVYEWRIGYELSIAAWYCDEYAVGLRSCHRLLYEDRLPSAEREATEKNLALYPPDAIGD